MINIGRYLYSPHRSYNNLWQTWSAIYRDWLPSCELKLLGELPFEVDLDDKHKVTLEKLRTKIVFAVD